MRKFLVHVNGNSYEVEVEEVKDGVVTAPRAVAPVAAPTAVAAPTPVAKKAVAPKVAASANALKAPMPGNIWKVLVKPGDVVKKGQALVILEAMKMENEITATADGTVTAVLVKEGDAVSSGDVLVNM